MRFRKKRMQKEPGSFVLGASPRVKWLWILYTPRTCHSSSLLIVALLVDTDVAIITTKVLIVGMPWFSNRSRIMTLSNLQLLQIIYQCSTIWIDKEASRLFAGSLMEDPSWSTNQRSTLRTSWPTISIKRSMRPSSAN